MSNKIVRTYIHGDKDTNHWAGSNQGLTGEALKNFQYAGYELELTYDVNEQTGEMTLEIIRDGKKYYDLSNNLN